MESNNIEQRVKTLEKEVAELKLKLNGGLDHGTPGWYDDVSGSLKNVPNDVYDEYRRCCRGFSESQDDVTE